MEFCYLSESLHLKHRPHTVSGAIAEVIDMTTSWPVTLPKIIDDVVKVKEVPINIIRATLVGMYGKGKFITRVNSEGCLVIYQAGSKPNRGE